MTIQEQFAAKQDRLRREYEAAKKKHAQAYRDEVDRAYRADQEAKRRTHQEERITAARERYREEWLAAHPLADPGEYDKPATWRPFIDSKLADENAAATARQAAVVKTTMGL